MANVYIEPRPKGDEGDRIDHYVVEDHADSELISCKSAGVEFIDFDGRPALRSASTPQSPALSDEAALPEMPKGAEDDYNGSAM